MFQDEARFGRINDVRRCWAPLPVRPLCRAMLTHEYIYAYGAVNVVTGEPSTLMRIDPGLLTFSDPPDLEGRQRLFCKGKTQLLPNQRVAHLHAKP